MDETENKSNNPDIDVFVFAFFVQYILHCTAKAKLFAKGRGECHQKYVDCELSDVVGFNKLFC